MVIDHPLVSFGFEAQSVEGHCQSFLQSVARLTASIPALSGCSINEWLRKAMPISHWGGQIGDL